MNLLSFESRARVDEKFICKNIKKNSLYEVSILIAFCRPDQVLIQLDVQINVFGRGSRDLAFRLAEFSPECFYLITQINIDARARYFHLFLKFPYKKRLICRSPLLCETPNNHKRLISVDSFAFYLRQPWINMNQVARPLTSFIRVSVQWDHPEVRRQRYDTYCRCARKRCNVCMTSRRIHA